jgi:CubicO group peptidase (beta-lactamase class C family)
MSRGLTRQGLEALDAALARHVDQVELPGLVALVARDDDVHVAAVGHKAFGDREPIGRDAIFRIASLTKPIAGVAAMLLIQDGAMALDDPVGRWLPELAEPRILRSLAAELDDTVPAEPKPAIAGASVHRADKNSIASVRGGKRKDTVSPMRFTVPLVSTYITSG